MTPIEAVKRVTGMEQLYEVETKEYKTYYVLARGYDNAKNKVELKIIDSDDSSILTEDGSLNTKCTIDTVKSIKCLGDIIN